MKRKQFKNQLFAIFRFELDYRIWDFINKPYYDRIWYTFCKPTWENAIGGLYIALVKVRWSK